MKRTIRLFLLSTLALSLLLIVSGAQPARRTPPAGKVNIPCPANIKQKHIDKCPDTGCGLLDPNLNRRKNVEFVNAGAEDTALDEIKALPDPVPGFEIG